MACKALELGIGAWLREGRTCVHNGKGLPHLLLTTSHPIPQDTFRKNAMGMATLGQVGGAEAVGAVAALEAQVGQGHLKLSIFRGMESMVPPDLLRTMA